MLKAILKTMKINHYLKNILVFVPLIFSLNFFSFELFAKTTAAFVAFCAISSVVYILNDIIDCKNDRLHPTKCTRPIASGKLPIWLALIILLVLLGASCAISFKINSLCLFMILSYLALNILYSLKLKNIALIDVACIAFGFILRVLIGCFAISVVPSPLVILLTFFASMFFTFSKRKLELQQLEEVSKCRDSLKEMDTNLVNQFVVINAVLAIAFYFTYMLDPQTIQRAGSDLLFVTVIPFTLIVFHLLFLINKSKNDDPIIFFEKDMTLKILLLFYIAVLFVVLAV